MAKITEIVISPKDLAKLIGFEKGYVTAVSRRLTKTRLRMEIKIEVHEED